ncbi:MAG: hypothetical protein RLZZ90_1010 [Actinomycetota bacterium]|jgi:hypothetical protein
MSELKAAQAAKQDRRSKNIFVQLVRFVVLNLRIFMLTKHKH